jgi:hypothetical protein
MQRERSDSGAPETIDPPQHRKEGRRDDARGLAPPTRSENHRDELGVAQDLDPACDGTLARPAMGGGFHLQRGAGRAFHARADSIARAMTAAE